MERNIDPRDIQARIDRAKMEGDDLAVAAFTFYFVELGRIANEAEGGFITYPGSAIRWNPREKIFDRDGEYIYLPPRKTGKLMGLLASRVGEACSREDLCATLYGDDGTKSRGKLAYLLWNLRGAIEPDPRNPVLIISPASARGGQSLERLVFDPQGIPREE